MANWRPEGGRWNALVAAWKNGEPKSRLIRLGIFGLPQMIFPWGEPVYWRLADRFGEETWWAPQNLWRELVHFTFGFLISQGLAFLHPWIGPSLAFAAIGYNEFYQDAKETGLEVKNFVDLAGWLLGALLPIFYMRG